MNQLTVTTPTGRTLRVHTAGDAAHPVVFVLHGTPSSGMLYPPNVEDAAARGLRLVSYDRPGYGGSTPHPGRRVADAAADVGTIADHLGLDRFAVWGHSGGAPHALACAALAGDRLVATAALSGPAPYDAEGLDWTAGMGESNVEDFALAVAGGDAYEARLREQRVEMVGADPEAVREVLKTLLSEVDRAELTGQVVAFMTAATNEGMEPGVDGMRDDDRAFIDPWGFDLASIPGPLRIYHGRHDRFVPASHGEWLAAQIPAAEAHISDGEGHLTLYTRGARECHAWFAELLGG
ncbi:MAG TPA: alpha/beta hydrolase [Gaiellales bacterium]|nr:alpha/beta hydrolase [Gaiellales bacterium]